MKIERVLAPNPGPFTGPGTNTWIVDDGGSVVVIDPGPLDREHERAIIDIVDNRHVVAVLVTHTHIDHAPLANPLARDIAVPALGYGPGPRFEPDQKLGEDSHLDFGSTSLHVVYTPGHSDDHLCFLVDKILFTGDHIMGGSSVMVEDMSAYLRSLARVGQLDVDRLYPGHGDVMDDPHQVVDWYVAHRLQREKEILAALAGGAGTVSDIVDVVYRDVDRSLHALAARSVSAHLRKLGDEGRVSFDGTRAVLSSP